MLRRTLFLAASLFLAATSFSLEAAPPREADHSALRELKAKVTAAVNAQDLKTLAGCFAREFSFTTADQTLITTPAELTAYYDRIFRQGKTPAVGLAIAPEADVLTRFLGDNTYYLAIAVDKDMASLGNIRLMARQFSDALWNLVPKRKR